MPEDTILGYLLYHDPSKAFFIELPDGADSWEMPLLFASFADRGEYSIDSSWSRRFVRQRTSCFPRQKSCSGKKHSPSRQQCSCSASAPVFSASPSSMHGSLHLIHQHPVLIIQLPAYQVSHSRLLRVILDSCIVFLIQIVDKFPFQSGS